MSWKKVKLGDLIDNFSVRAKDYGGSENLEFFGVSNEHGIIKTKYAAEDKAEDYKIIEKGCFTYNPYRVNVGSIGLYEEEDRGLISPAYVVFKPKFEKIIPELLLKFLKSGEGLRQIIFQARGTVRQALRFDDLCKLELLLPNYIEQRVVYNKLNLIEIENNKITSELNHQLSLVKKLKQQLLNNAVQGKLVTQNFNDEPASALLARIKTEKAQSGKKEKPLPLITKTEIPFEIPSNWVWCRLGEIGDLKRGKSKHRPRNDESLFENGIYPFIQTGDVSKAKFNQDLIITVNNYYNEFGLKQSEMQMKGTFCITIAANIAECGFLDFDACVPDSIVCFSALNKYFEKYAFYYLKIAKEELEKFAPATAQKNINLGILNDLRIPIPPLEEQKRIVEKLEHLMAQCNALETHITESAALNAQLLQQVLREALQSEK